MEENIIAAHKPLYQSVDLKLLYLDLKYHRIIDVQELPEEGYAYVIVEFYFTGGDSFYKLYKWEYIEDEFENCVGTFEFRCLACSEYKKNISQKIYKEFEKKFNKKYDNGLPSDVIELVKLCFKASLIRDNKKIQRKINRLQSQIYDLRSQCDTKFIDLCVDK